MSKRKKVILAIIAILFLLPVIMSVIITAVNDSTAASVAKQLKQYALPQDTMYVESISKVGKLSGNGNGMQYYGAMLITSELSLEQLKEYYSQYDCYVYQQNTARLEELHGSLCFSTDPVPDNAYRVELWGDSPSWFFADLDIRGH